MRIVSGKHRGKFIKAPVNIPSRPTTDMAKESLFNILNNSIYFDEVSVLDLYAGTGNISYEFLSRGSERVLAIDKHPGCVSFIMKMAKELDAEAELDVHKTNVMNYLKRGSEKFDIIFADPPYEYPEYDDLINLVFDQQSLKEDGLFILEHDFKQDFKSSPYFDKHKKYGNVNFSFFKYPDSENAE